LPSIYPMSDEVVNTTAIGPNTKFQNSEPDTYWVSRPVAESITQAMEAQPLGAMHQIIYASLSSKLKSILTPSNPLFDLFSSTFVNTAINFRALNPQMNYPERVPALPPSSAQQTQVWGMPHDPRLPNSLPEGVANVSFAPGQNPQTEQNQGLLVAKLFSDLQSHIPLVLMNISERRVAPQSIGGGAITGRKFKDGKAVTELSYVCFVSVTMTAVTGDDQATNELQSIIESCFSTLRDSTGSMVYGRKWQLTMPTSVATETITEVDMPGSGGQTKNNKLYVGTVTLQNLLFDCVSYIERPAQLEVSANPVGGYTPNIQLVGESSSTGPMQMLLGKPQQLVVGGLKMSETLVVSQTKGVIELQKTLGGFWRILPKRTGEATICVYDTGSYLPVNFTGMPPGAAEAATYTRKVVVTAV
jgi:hypothetical protein